MTRVWEKRTNFALISCGLRLAKGTEGTTTKQGYTCLAGAQAQQGTLHKGLHPTYMWQGHSAMITVIAYEKLWCRMQTDFGWSCVAAPFDR